MKRFFTKNKLFVFTFILFIIFGFLSIIPLKEYDINRKSLIDEYNSVIDKCNNTNQNEMEEREKTICKAYLDIDSSKFNKTVYEGYDHASDFYREYLSELIITLIIIICSTYYITKFLRNRIILNTIYREKYKSIIKKIFFSAWRYACVFPTMLLIVFILTYLFTGNGSDGYTYMEGTIFENNVLLYFSFIFIQSFILTLLHTNISLIIARKEHNYILAVIKSFVCIIGIQLLFEVLNNWIYRIFNGSLNFSFNIMNMYTIYDEENILNNMICMLVILAISFAILFISYKNKEKLIIDSEKNDNKGEE